MAGQIAAAFDREITKRVAGRYLLFLPTGYDPESGQRWPLMLFLHGAGERGDDLEQVKNWGVPSMVDQWPDFPFILVSPQCPAGEYWDVDALNTLLDELEERFAVDPDRIYLTGLSMGGFGTFALGLKHPERFAALAPICGGGERLWVRPEHAGLPIWVFHGAKDTVVPISRSESMVDALRAVGADVRFTVYPEAEHNSWSETYANRELYDWFLQHKRSARP
jgi:predicted peptidase